MRLEAANPNRKLQISNLQVEKNSHLFLYLCFMASFDELVEFFFNFSIHCKNNEGIGRSKVK